MHRLFPVLVSLLFVSLVAGPTARSASRLVGDLPRAGDKPLESYPGLDTEYGELRPGDGARLRTIVTRPSGSAGRLPAVLFVQWLSCDSIELGPDPTDGWGVMQKRLITESNMLWQRTDKSGIGDSTGVECSKLD